MDKNEAPAMANNNERDYTSCLNSIMDFCLPEQVPKINMLLFGGVGSGKSSIVSTLDSLFKGRISHRAPHGKVTGSYTRKLTKYSFKTECLGANGKLETKEAPFVLWDIPGCSTTFKDYKPGELGYILDGNLPNHSDLSRNILPQSRNNINVPDLADRVHCVCFVVSCIIGQEHEEYARRLNAVKKEAVDRGIPILLFLTKVDECDADAAADISMLRDSPSIRSKMRALGHLFGVGGTKDVFPMKSFNSEQKPDQAVGIPIFHALQQALYAAVDYLEEAQDALKHSKPPCQESQQDSPQSAEALATTTDTTVYTQAEKDCDQESAEWEALPLLQGHID